MAEMIIKEETAAAQPADRLAGLTHEYGQIICAYLAQPSERWRYEAGALGKQLVALQQGPEVLLKLHTLALQRCPPSLALQTAPMEILLEAMMAFAMEYYRLAEERKKEQERLTTHARVLENLNRDLMELHHELAEKHEDLQTSHRKLSLLLQQKSDLLATVTHEIRTPLTSILGYGEFLEDGTYGVLNPEQAEVLHRIIQGGKDMLLLIDTILDLSRLEASRLQLDQQSVQLPAIVYHAAEQIRSQAIRKHLALDISNVPATLPAIWADSLRVLEILVNLLGNAVKFTPESGRIEIGAIPKNEWVEVWIRDSGPGIEPEQQRQLFEKYTQASADARRYGGSGLGLALCKELVVLHGGKIWIESEVGKGATFRFTLPVFKANAR
ncbi:MAG: HAMP domain-containing histidine kinase [Cyanobacteria bacterium NC_groundwater_1444_Ag_S-0.65um_54_12]|nr:HAMP domain-containing histidine kinase [Cyanobacteria bacterium NC_groundwater_1444_Ag_S-0.65um_54_12]